MKQTIIHAVIIVSLVTVGSSPARAMSDPKSSAQDRSTAFVADGDAAFERGDYEEAVHKYRAAYYGLTPEQRTSYIGSIPVRNAMAAYQFLLAERQDRTVLEQQLGFLTEFLESVRAQEGGVTRVGQAVFAELEGTRTEIEKKLAALAQVVAPPPDPEDTPEVDDEVPEVDPEEAVTAMPPPPPPRSWLGLGLAIGGGAAVGIGAGVMAGWWTVRRAAETRASEKWGADLGSPDRARYLTDQWYRARRYLTAGVVLTGLGAAAATAGGVLILIRRGHGGGSGATAGLTPAFGRDGAGLQLTGRF